MANLNELLDILSHDPLLILPGSEHGAGTLLSELIEEAESKGINARRVNPFITNSPAEIAEHAHAARNLSCYDSVDSMKELQHLVDEAERSNVMLAVVCDPMVADTLGSELESRFSILRAIAPFTFILDRGGREWKIGKQA